MNRLKAQLVFLALYPVCLGFAALAFFCLVPADLDDTIDRDVR